MRQTIIANSICFVFACAAVAALRAQPQNAAPANTPALRLSTTIPLPNVGGRIDHLTFDATTGRLFIAALGNNTVEVVDTVKRAHLRSIPGFHEPQGLAVVPDGRGVVVANGATGTAQMLDGETLQIRWTADIGGDADNVRYDSARKMVFVAFEGGLAAVDPASGGVVRRIAIAGHPESFQLEGAAARVFANLPGASQIIVADRNAMAVRSRWDAGGCRGNYPMALDESSGRLFVGCRRPASLAMIDTASGKTIASTPSVGDTDDLFYDGSRKRVYVIGGEGFIDVFQRGADELKRVDRIATRDGARTGLWVGAQSRLYIAVPARRGQTAEVRVFEAH
jgi:DNA-binding beta-propeller fold protein YncE